VGGLPRTRRRSIHASRNLSRAPPASLVIGYADPGQNPSAVRFGSSRVRGEGSGQDRARSQRRGDCGNGAQDQRLTATAAANGNQQPTATSSDRRQRITLARSAPTGDTSGLKNGRSFDGAVPPRTWPTHYGPVSPRCPRTAINSQRSPPAATCEHEAGARFEPASNAREHPRNA
jgi:hypothetical protein